MFNNSWAAAIAPFPRDGGRNVTTFAVTHPPIDAIHGLTSRRATHI
jgi:hypothetical protein